MSTQVNDTRWEGAIDTLTPLTQLTGSYGFAEDINESGDVVGMGYGPNTATSWDGTTNAATELIPLLDPLPGSGWTGAEAINDNGVIVGLTNDGTQSTATRWDGETSTPIALAPLAGGSGSGALGINNNGDVVGTSFGGSLNVIATLWDGITNQPTARDPLAGGTYGRAEAINDNGYVVGWSGGGLLSGQRATIWGSDGLPIDLTSMLELGAIGWVLLQAWDINASGQIVGRGINPDGEYRGFLVTPNVAPVPLPAGAWLLLLALGGLGLVDWRRKKTAAA